MLPDPNTVNLVHVTAQRYDLFPHVVLGLIEQESAWNPWAWNPEPRYRWFVNVKTRQPFRRPTDEEIRSEIPPDDFPALAGDRDQEWWAQQASWGLGQIMGAVARERGFDGPYLPAILRPELNVMLLCAHLAHLLSRQEGNLQKALLHYNGGGDPQYPVKVLTRAQTYLKKGATV